MKQDEILQAAKEAGIEFKPLPRDLYCEAWLEQLEHLASIIEKRTIERCAELQYTRSCTRHGYDKHDDAAAIRKLGGTVMNENKYTPGRSMEGV